MDHHPLIKAGLDISSIAVIGGAFTGYLPEIATLLSIAWYLYSFYKAFRKHRDWED